MRVSQLGGPLAGGVWVGRSLSRARPVVSRHTHTHTHACAHTRTHTLHCVLSILSSSMSMCTLQDSGPSTWDHGAWIPADSITGKPGDSGPRSRTQAHPEQVPRRSPGDRWEGKSVPTAHTQKTPPRFYETSCVGSRGAAFMGLL